MNPDLEIRRINLTYSSKCGNPECVRGTLPPGTEVIVYNKRIYCDTDCATAHLASLPTRRTRRTVDKSQSKT